jgi:hypothetical protein
MTLNRQAAENAKKNVGHDLLRVTRYRQTS